MNETATPAQPRPDAGPQDPSPADLIARARDMVPALRARAAACEAQRQVPAETIEELRAAGLFNVCKPREYGGYEMGWDVICEICMELARGCGSSAWVYAVLAEHNNTLAGYPLQAQADVWGPDQDALVASGNAPDATMERVAGGFRINGVLNYASGCDFATWHLTGMPRAETPLKILLPQEGCRVIDNWQVSGLAGTGSKDIEMIDVFLPDHRTIPVGERGPRFDQHPVFRMPQWSVNPTDLASVAVGIAAGIIETFVEAMQPRMSRFGDSVADFQSLQLRIAESAAEVHAARTLILENMRETMAVLEHADELPVEIRARNKRDMAYCPILATRAADRLFYAAGAAALFLSNDIQRSFRDVHACSKQIALNWDVNGTTYGRVALGLDPGRVRW